MENKSKTNRTKAQRYKTFIAGGSIWKDANSYSQNTNEETPATSFKTIIGGCEIFITIGHVYYRGEWIFSCKKLEFDCIPLPTGIDEIKAAELAIEKCKNYVDELYKAFWNVV